MNKYKMVLSKNNHIINSVEEWREFAPPKRGDLHWKDGRSAKELAKYMVSGNGFLPDEIENVLGSINFNEDISFIGEPEAVTNLKGKGEGRNHDILLNGDNKIIIGVEAKVDEPFGNSVSIEISKGSSKNKKERIRDLYSNIIGSFPGDNYDPKYQLLIAAAGTLIEAEKYHSPNAMLLIITFKNGTYFSENKVNRNLDDINYFMNSIETWKNEGGFKLPGYKDIMFYVEHIEI